jgi:hypothetical protein
MAVNRYDSPAQDRYFNTYVPLPFEQLMPVVAQRQQQVQREQDMLSKVYDDTQNIEYIPDSKDEAYVKDYLAKTGDLVSKYYGQDLSDPVVKQQMLSQFRGMTDRTRLQNVQTSAANWKQNLKLKAQLRAEGMYDPLLDEDPATGWDSSQGVYQYITSPYKNPRPTAEAIFNNVKASDLGASGDYWYEGVSENKINQVAEAKWNEFANSSDGSLYVKKIAKERGLDPNDIASRKQIAMEYLKGVGQEYVYRQRGGMLPEASRKGAGSEDEGAGFINTTQEQAYREKADFNPLGIRKYKFDKSGNLAVPEGTKEHLGTVAGLSPSGMSSGAIGEVETKRLREEAKKDFDLIREKYPKLAGKSDAETYKAYMDLTKDGKAFPDLPLVDLPNVPKTALADYISDSILNRSVMVMDDFGSSDVRPITDDSQYAPMRDLGYSAQEVKSELKKFAKGDAKALISVAGLSQNGPHSGMIQLEVYDKSGKGGGKGKPRKVYITSNDQMKAIMAPTNDVYNTIRGMQGGAVYIGDDPDGRNVAVNVVPDISQDSKTKKWQYDYQLEGGYLDENGNFVPNKDEEGNTEIVTMSQLKNMQMNRLVNSKLINSVMNYTKNTAPGF